MPAEYLQRNKFCYRQKKIPIFYNRLWKNNYPAATDIRCSSWINYLISQKLCDVTLLLSGVPRLAKFRNALLWCMRVRSARVINNKESAILRVMGALFFLYRNKLVCLALLSYLLNCCMQFCSFLYKLPPQTYGFLSRVNLHIVRDAYVADKIAII